METWVFGIGRVVGGAKRRWERKGGNGGGQGGRTRGGWRKMEKMEEENKWKDKQGIYLKNQLFLCLSSYSTKQMKGKDTAGNARKHDTVAYQVLSSIWMSSGQ